MSAPLVPVQPASPRPARRLRAKLGALAFSSLLGAAAVELAARCVITEGPRLAGRSLSENAFHESLDVPSNTGAFGLGYARDRQLGFRLGANLDTSCAFPEAPGEAYRIRTNALAVRDDRPLTEKKGRRVLVLGDSMTFGIGVEREQAFPARLEKELGPGFEVVNVGCCMWGQSEEVAFLEHRASALAPDLVVVQITVANDVLDDLRYRSSGSDELITDPTLCEDLKQHPLLRMPLLADHSRAYRALAWQLGRHAIRYRAMKEPWRLERAAVLVRRARDIATKLGARFAILIAPTAAQLEHSFADRLLGTRAINDFFLQFALREGIPTCDPSAQLQAVYAKSHTPYFPIDKHWNPEGHEAVAAALAPLAAELLK